MHQILYGVDFVDSLTGFAVGTDAFYGFGFITSTNDGGKNWNIKGCCGRLRDVSFLDKNTGWVVGDNGIFRTTNGGINWSVQDTTVLTLRRITLLHKEKVIYVFGKNNTLLRADLVTGVDEYNEYNKDTTNSVAKFSLSQNFPNPFNSQTTIEYTIEKTSPVQLKIFNILGHEVRTLINQTQLYGNYKIIWDGRTNKGDIVPSGIYIYQLTTENKTESRKMVFLR